MTFLNRIAKYAILIAIVLLVVSISACLMTNRDPVTPPHIDPLQTNLTLPDPVHVFPFGQAIITISSPVDSSVYAGAKAADKETIIRGNISREVWIQDTYLAMIHDPNQEQFYTHLISAMRTIRDKENLSDDEYLELMTVFVQSIRYETSTENPPKFPVETYVDKSGDCDDKSLLLAGLLSREGYNVSLLSFTPESHMAVGVVCPEGEYRQTGYTYIETTNFSFVGVAPETLNGGIEITSDPLVIHVGNGTKTFGSCSESLYLNSVYKSSEQNVKDLTVRIDTLRTEMDGYYAKRDADNYNQRVPIFNDLQRKRLQFAEVHNYILQHQFDRKGAGQYVKANLPT